MLSTYLLVSVPFSSSSHTHGIMNLAHIGETNRVQAHTIYMAVLVQILLVQPEGSSHPEVLESINGITPAMRNARKRHFNNAHVDHQEVQAVEDDLLQLASVRWATQPPCWPYAAVQQSA